MRIPSRPCLQSLTPTGPPALHQAVAARTEESQVLFLGSWRTEDFFKVPGNPSDPHWPLTSTAPYVRWSETSLRSWGHKYSIGEQTSWTSKAIRLKTMGAVWDRTAFQEWLWQYTQAIRNFPSAIHSDLSSAYHYQPSPVNAKLNKLWSHQTKLVRQISSPAIRTPSNRCQGRFTYLELWKQIGKTSPSNGFRRNIKNCGRVRETPILHNLFFFSHNQKNTQYLREPQRQMFGLAVKMPRPHPGMPCFNAHVCLLTADSC